MIVFDLSILLLFLDEEARPPIDPATGEAVSACKARLDYLIAQFRRDRTKVVIPTPVVSEVLVWADAAGPEYLEILTRSSRFEVVPFDLRAAVEVARMTRCAIVSGGAKAPKISRAKIKVDRQIVAIASVVGATAIYSDDKHIVRLAKPLGIDVIGIAELPLPPEKSQADLFEGAADEGAADEGAADEGAADEGAADEGAADEGAADEGR